MILVGDIGGTHTRLGLADPTASSLAPVTVETFASADWPELAPLLETVIAKSPRPVTRACLGVAGPVRNGECHTTNLPWTIHSAQLTERLGLEQVALLNDLEALGWSVGQISSDRLAVLSAGEPCETGNACLIAAGTGLGEAGLAWSPAGRRPFASEGGHSSFAPCSELERALLEFLARRFGHVSWERVVSGPGLVLLHEFLLEHHRDTPPAWLVDEMRAGDAAAALSRAATSGRSEMASRALDLFLRLYGSEAGNLALKTMATAGIYVGGGIAPKILDRLKAGPFLEALHAKGRMRPLLESMPVTVVLDDGAALLGAAFYATHQIASFPAPFLPH